METILLYRVEKKAAMGYNTNNRFDEVLNETDYIRI